MMNGYRLRKARKILFATFELYKKKKKSLEPHQVREIEADLKALQDAIMHREVEKAVVLSEKCSSYSKTYLKKSAFTHFVELIGALCFALVIALVIRQMWFELYEIPTGSMRPTFKEQDRLVVSKTTFGLNFPFSTKHFYFDPELVKRSGIIIFSVENMDVRDPDTMYFYLFPGKKQFVKRLLGKPGDILYFYGGQIYGIDKDGSDISKELQLAITDRIDHIPFIHFEGNMSFANPMRLGTGELYQTVFIHQMNEPIAKLSSIGEYRLEGEMLRLSSIHKASAPAVKNYGDLWGINHFASAKLLTKDQVKPFLTKNNLTIQDAPLYLELKHHPNLNSLKIGRDRWGRLHPIFQLKTSLIPLQERHVRDLFSNLYTARFYVKGGRAVRYSIETPTTSGISSQIVPFAGVPDGCYEFYYGKAYEIGWGGTAIELPLNHPLYQFSLERAAFLFNFGIDFETRFLTDPFNELLETSRYAYYRNQDLFVMGVPIFKQDDPTLMTFVENERARQTSTATYEPFVDLGPPLKESGEIDREKIEQFGLLIPDKMYLALGDNYAMSSDSRDFGFVPQGNLRGAPSWIFWPFGSRWGAPNQLPYAFLTLPNLFVWFIVIVCLIIWWILHRRRHRLPLSIENAR